MDSIEIAKYLIEHNLFMTIASADANGKPWSTPVGFAYDDNFNFYWISSKDALHSQNIRQRPEIALSIYGKVPDNGYDGLYVDAEATELSDENEIKVGIKLFKDYRPQPPRFMADSATDVMGDSQWRMYKASPVKLFKRLNSEVAGRAVTVRQELDMKSL